MPQPQPPVGLVCSVPLEAEPVLRRVDGMVELRIGGRAAARGELGGVPVVVLVGGMGKTNAAQAVTALLEGGHAGEVVGFGVAGAYAGSGLRTGDVALATREIYGDEGVTAPGGWMSTEGIGIPLLERGEARYFNEFGFPDAEVARALRALREWGIETRSGPFVTVSCCSGTAARGRELAERFGAICETMEGAAYAHVCAHYGVPFLEVRGVSNLVEDRDLSRWRLGDAAQAAAHGVSALVGRL